MESLFTYQNSILASMQFLFRRDIMDQIAWEERLVGLYGARGVGKTTMMLQRFQESNFPEECKLYITMDNLSMRFDSLLKLATTFHERGGRMLFVDEIHKYPQWSAELKNIYDLLPGLQIVFSGSSQLNIRSGEVDLSRRAVMYQVRGLSFREFLQIQLSTEFPVLTLKNILTNHVSCARDINKKVKPLKHFYDYLKWGYFPFYLQSEKTYSLKLQSVLNFIIENEIPAFSGLDVRNVSKIKRLLQMIAQSVPFQPNIVKLAAALEINRNTLLQYLKILEQAEIIQNIYSHGSFYSKLTKPGKVLLQHPNIAWCLGTEEANTGSIRESFFANQLRATHNVELASKADFMIDDKYTFEIGGSGKTHKQIAGTPYSFLVADDISQGIDNKIPLWIFGFLY